MLHSASGFKGIRVGATEGAPPRHEPLERAGVRQPRIRVSYWCAKGHETALVFAKLPEEQIPGVWDCRRCGGTATRDETKFALEDAPARASRPTWNTLKSGAPARTPKTCWPERWNGYAPDGPFRTSCSGTREAAFSSISHRVSRRPRGPAAGTCTGLAPARARPRRRPCPHRPPPSTPQTPY